MDSLPMHKWLLGKALFKVNENELTTAIRIMADKVDKAAAQTPKLKVEFFKTSQPTDDQDLTEPVLIGTFPTLRAAPSRLWNEAGMIVATFTTAASDMAPAMTATVCLGGLTRTHGRTRREIHFEVNPPEIGRNIGRHFMNEEPYFIFWNKGVRYN